MVKKAKEVVLEELEVSDRIREVTETPPVSLLDTLLDTHEHIHVDDYEKKLEEEEMDEWLADVYDYEDEDEEEEDEYYRDPVDTGCGCH